MRPDRTWSSVRVPPQFEAWFTQVDEWMVSYLVEHSERIFKKQLTLEQVRESYSPCLKRQGDYPALLRTKINSTGRGACRFWGTEQRVRDAPDEWRGCEFKAMFHLSHPWIMGTSCGLVINTTDLLVQEISTAFPWAGEEPPAW